jgi:hypothetical protein
VDLFVKANNWYNPTIGSFYNRNVVKPEAWSTIQKDLNQRLPIYKASFKQSAAKYNLDWHLLLQLVIKNLILNPHRFLPRCSRFDDVDQ